MNQRFRRLTELFVDGSALPMPDGTHLWIQVINAYERDEALSDAQVGRSRLIMALKDKGDERLKVLARLEEHGRDRMVEDLAGVRAQAKMGEYFEELRAEPEWKDRMEIIMRTDWESSAKPASVDEIAVMGRINSEVIAEIERRQLEEQQFLERKLKRMDDADFVEEWIDEWIERRGTELAQAEYRLTETWYAARFCEGVAGEFGGLDHTRCDGHTERVFPTKADARAAPTRLQELIRAALDDLNMAAIDPKDSGRPPNSSDSPPTPSEPVVSTPSTSTATPPEAPGTSPPQ